MRCLLVNFFTFIEARLHYGLTLDGRELGWIGLVISWLLQMVFPYFIAQYKISIILMKNAINKIPEEVIEYTIYLFEMGKTESDVKAELSQKGWKKEEDQARIFDALGAIFAFKENYRE